jgi:hypothetical protein
MKTPPEKLARIIAWAKENPEKVKANQAAWIAANPEKRRASLEKYYKKNREKCLASRRRWREENRARGNQMSLAWLKKHPEKRASYGALHRAAKLRATPTWANRFFIEEAYDLAQRRTKATGFRWHVDHIVPLQSKTVCGLHVENNLQVVPAFRNQSKGNRHWPDMSNDDNTQGG